MKKFTLFKKGFTLVELMVVIAIISLLTGIIVSNLTSSRAKARDAKRISDVGQIQLALELYFDRCKSYPVPEGVGVVPSDFTCAANENIKLSNYISKIPQPSTEAGQSSGYEYFVDNAIAPSDYILKAKLENYSEVLKDGLSSVSAHTSMPAWASSVTCDNSPTTGRDYCISPK